jgi:hypothetical protein
MKEIEIALLFILTLSVIVLIMIMWKLHDELGYVEPAPIYTIPDFLYALSLEFDTQELTPLFYTLRGFDPADPPGTIRSDSENVHDSEVNQLIKQSIDILLAKYNKDDTKINDIGYYVTYRRMPKDIEYRPVTLQEFKKGIKKFEDEKNLVIYFDITPMNAINLAWQRADDTANKANKQNIKEAILYAIMDPTHVCAHGMVSAVIGALDGLDQIGDLPPIISKQITRSMVSDTAGIKYKEILKDIAYDTKLDAALRLVAVENLALEDESLKYLSASNVTNAEKIRAQEVLKTKLRPKLHNKLGEIYGEKYVPFMSDINGMVDIMC